MEGQSEPLGSTRDGLIGQLVHDRYRIVRQVGRGGMGTVYLARHVKIGRDYAIKVMSERAPSDELVARFQREAMAAAAVGSDHVVEVTDMGSLEDGSHFIVLEYLDGVDLSDAVAQQGPFSLARALRVVSQVCDGLEAAHAQGIVHRDLKPENIFLTTRGGTADFVKILDFGICKLVEPRGEPGALGAGGRALTHTNASMGTPQYMAPEQFRGSERVDQRADVHAVGAILFFLLTGRPPFDADSMQVLLIQICTEQPPSARALREDLPSGLDNVLKHAMSKTPESRIASAAELKEALLPFLGEAELTESSFAAAPIPLAKPHPPSPSPYPTPASGAPTRISTPSGTEHDLDEPPTVPMLRLGLWPWLALLAFAGGGLWLSTVSSEPTPQRARTSPPVPAEAPLSDAAPARTQRQEKSEPDAQAKEPTTSGQDETAQAAPAARKRRRRPSTDRRDESARFGPSPDAAAQSPHDAGGADGGTETAEKPTKAEQTRPAADTHRMPTRDLMDVFESESPQPY